MSTSNALPAEVLPELSRLLSSHFGSVVSVRDQEWLKSGRTSIYRLSLSGAPVSSAICRYGERDEQLWNELAGMRFLAQLPHPPSLVPAFYAGGPLGTDKAAVLSEDIGSSPDLAEILLRGTAEQARAGLEGYVDALLDVHLATFGRQASHAAIRAEYDPPRSFEEQLGSGPWAQLAEGIEKLGLGPVPTGVPDAIAWVDSQLAETDRWWARRVRLVEAAGNVGRSTTAPRSETERAGRDHQHGV